MPDWMTSGSHPTTHASGGGGNSSLWPDFLSNNPVSEAVGHAGDWMSHNPATSVGVRFFTGPHQLVDFASHDWIAGLWALGKKVGHDVSTPSVWLEDPRRYLRDPHTLGGGFLTPLVESYNQKYRTTAILGDLARGDYGGALHEVGRAGHNEAQDPFGTLLDLTVGGKALGAAHLTHLEKAAAAGKIGEGSRLARVLDENPRTFTVYPSKDRLGNPYQGAKGVEITKTNRGATTQGRLLQSYLDDIRLQLPEHVPFSAHRLSSRETLRQVQQVFQRNSYPIRAAAQKIDQLPDEGLRYAVQHVAELPRDVATVGNDPIGHLLDFYQKEHDWLAGEREKRNLGRLGDIRMKAISHRVEVLGKINQVKDVIYDPAHPLHAQFMEAYRAAEHADQVVRRELVRRGLVHQHTLEAQDVLVHRLLRNTRYDVGKPQKDVLGTYQGQTIEEALAQQQAALENPQLANPLGQYGESWHWPHEAFAVVGAPEGILRNIAHRVLHEEPRSHQLADYAAGAARTRPGDTWLEGLINSHPETLTTSHFHKWAEIRAQDFVNEYLYPMSGRLESGKGYEQGGKLSNETYILKPKQFTELPLSTTRTHFRTLGELLHAAPSLRRITEGKNKESMQQWVNRLDQQGVRRVKTKYVDRWERETRTSRPLFQKIVHGGLNQVWRYLLLGIKPSWAIANYYTNQALVLLKNAGRGGIQAFLAMARDASERNLMKLAAYTRRMSLAPEVKYEVNKLIEQRLGPSYHDAINQADPVIHSSTFGRTRLFSPPRGGRAVPADALAPGGRFYQKWLHSPGYMSRRSLHILNAPARFVEKLNQSGEEFTRDQAYLAKLKQMTGKMAASGEDIQRILRDAKLKHDPQKLQELLMGHNGPMDALGDYSRMTSAERERIVAVMPFYPWYKTILNISAKFFAHDPERIWVLHAIAQGLGVVAAQDMQLGIPVASFAKDLIPVSGPRGDYQLTMSTRTWNPFQTPVDIANNIAAFATANPTSSTPNEVGLGLFGPAIQAGYTAATGKDPFYGGAYSGWGSGQGRPGAVIGSFFYGLPQKRLYDEITGNYKSKVFEAPNNTSARNVGLLQYLGIPVKYVNLPNMQTRAVEEGQKPTRQSARKPSGDWMTGG